LEREDRFSLGGTMSDKFTDVLLGKLIEVLRLDLRFALGGSATIPCKVWSFLWHRCSSQARVLAFPKKFHAFSSVQCAAPKGVDARTRQVAERRSTGRQRPPARKQNP
jgi:hypothetical protein